MIGIDIVDVSRITEVVMKYGEAFLNKVFADSEIDNVKDMKRKYESLAGRFAAKEAFMKAYGKRLAWKDVVVGHRGGKPFISFRGKKYHYVSISHEKSYAVSVVFMGTRRMDESTLA
jgi:holo-[acyl-carrier-protein] synthase